MLKRLALVSAKLLPLVIGLGTAFAQAPTGQTSWVAKMSKADKEAISKACSEKANAQGLHGEARKKFDPSANEPMAKQCSPSIVRRRTQRGEVVWVDNVRAACRWRCERRWAMGLALHLKRIRSLVTSQMSSCSQLSHRTYACSPAGRRVDDGAGAINSLRRNVPPQRTAIGWARSGFRRPGGG